MGADSNSPYDVLGINWKMASENIKKKYMLFSVKSVGLYVCLRFLLMCSIALLRK